AIEILGLRNTNLDAGVGDAVQELPADPGRLDPPFAAAAMEVVRPAEIILMALEYGQHIVPAPARQAKLAPAVVVRRLAAHVDHAVDGRGTAQNLAAGIIELPAAEPRLALRRQQPIGPGIADGAQIAGGDMQPDP